MLHIIIIIILHNIPNDDDLLKVKHLFYVASLSCLGSKATIAAVLAGSSYL